MKKKFFKHFFHGKINEEALRLLPSELLLSDYFGMYRTLYMLDNCIVCKIKRTSVDAVLLVTEGKPIRYALYCQTNTLLSQARTSLCRTAYAGNSGVKSRANTSVEQS